MNLFKKLNSQFQMFLTFPPLQLQAHFIKYLKMKYAKITQTLSENKEENCFQLVPLGQHNSDKKIDKDIIKKESNRPI